ncbi:MAG: serine/threonine protein kinase [Deltaproteobacteria bacterium]|nr:serine/threonine protein kinase [Deltaproteobacteria bacterium]
MGAPTEIENPPSAAGGEELAPGTFIGEYKIESKLGQGGMGAVYAARHPVIGKRVAVKVLSYFFSRDMALVRRFVDEARAVNKIGHPNIIDVFSFGQLADGRHYFVMEFLEGETLGEWLGKGRPDLAEAKRFLLQVCEALEAAHREGIIHRDLKPDNIWIARPKHGEPFVKVLDFGIAKLVESDEQKGATKTGTVMGTPQFMSPEQCVGRGVDHRTDIYALGAIVFRVYCGRLPFDAESAAEIIAAQLHAPPPKPSEIVTMPAALESLILECLDKDPEKRPPSAAELGMRLKDAAQTSGAITEIRAPRHATGKAAAATRKGFASDETEGQKRAAGSGRKWLVLAVAGGLLVAGAIALVLAMRGREPPAGRAPTVSQPQPVRAVVPPPPPPPPAPVQPPAPTASPAAALPAAAPAAEPATRKRAGAGRAGLDKRGAVLTPQPAPPSPERRRKPSRAAREGLIEENPFQ